MVQRHQGSALYREIDALNVCRCSLVRRTGEGGCSLTWILILPWRLALPNRERWQVWCSCTGRGKFAVALGTCLGVSQAGGGTFGIQYWALQTLPNNRQPHDRARMQVAAQTDSHRRRPVGVPDRVFWVRRQCSGELGGTHLSWHLDVGAVLLQLNSSHQ